ncbi:hypothetical protein KY346_05190 [Candidatus Woesearchaeota archaeon]|nr:hypothetical protein [Candidatus Woesearchaeota archaeon]
MLPELSGIIGAAIILFAFFMNQTEKWKSDSVIYDATNFVGAVLLGVYSYALRAWPFLVLNIIWALVSLREMQLDAKKKKRGHIGHKRK